MTTIVFECDCSITSVMGEDRKIVSVHLCDECLAENPELMQLMLKVIRESHGLK